MDIGLDKITPWWLPISYAVALTLLYFFFLVPFYNVFFHPLRKYPGPKLWAASPLPWGFSWMSGYWHKKIIDMHRHYGSVVRVGPNELSYSVPEVWEDIYGRQKPGQRQENPKPTWYLSPKTHEIVGAAHEDHGRMRRLLANGFTSTATAEQEPIIRAHVDLFIERLRDNAENGMAAIDLFQWLAFCTFDIIGDLSFGESFGCLQQSFMHPWIAWVFSNIKFAHDVILSKRIPFFAIFLPAMKTYRLYKDSIYYEKTLQAIVDKRQALEKERPDFMEIMMSKKGGLFMTQEEIYSNANFLTMAGAETSSNSLAVISYMVSTHPDVKAKIMKELLATFSNEDDINMRSVGKLAYLNAVIEETLRFHPPGPNAMWRMTPPGGNRILGDWVPGNTILAVPHRVMYRSEHNFKRADEYLPERWLTDGKKSEFAKDRRDGFHPFSYGPRQCLAVNFAYAEMRFILARMMWNFDFQVAEQSRKWLDGQRAWLMWEKRPLFMHLRAHEKAVTGV